mmetsp:Transcript_3291/g.9360  ORF Transcript_3291/g.9360 Transcript_3291/m.9360 type:complete len:260 (-) Transcript_3291:146-925(-)
MRSPSLPFPLASAMTGSKYNATNLPSSSLSWSLPAKCNLATSSATIATIDTSGWWTKSFRTSTNEHSSCVAVLHGPNASLKMTHQSDKARMACPRISSFSSWLLATSSSIGRYSDIKTRPEEYNPSFPRQLTPASLTRGLLLSSTAGTTCCDMSSMNAGVMDLIDAFSKTMVKIERIRRVFEVWMISLSASFSLFSVTVLTMPATHSMKSRSSPYAAFRASILSSIRSSGVVMALSIDVMTNAKCRRLPSSCNPTPLNT